MITTRYATRAEWLAARRKTIGGSDLASILGAPDAFATRTKVWERKVLGDAGAVAEEDEPEYLEWGNRLEPVILDVLADRAGIAFGDYERTPLTICRREGAPAWQAASPDALAFTTGPEPAVVLEAKTTNRWNAGEWADGPPLRYAVQVQWTMACTGAQEGLIGVLIGGQRFRWARVQRDEAFIVAASRAAEQFWHAVETRTPPRDVDADTRSVVERMFPVDDGSEVQLPAEFVDLTRRFHEAKAARERADREIEVIEGWITRALGPATVGVLPSGDAFTWKQQRRKAYVVHNPEWSGRVLRFQKAKEV